MSETNSDSFWLLFVKKKYVRTPWLWSVRVWPRWGPLQDWSSSEETTSRRKWQIKEKIMTSFLLQCPTSAARQFRLQRQQMFKKVTDTEFENIQVLFFICYVISIVNRKSVKHFFLAKSHDISDVRFPKSIYNILYYIIYILYCINNKLA